MSGFHVLKGFGVGLVLLGSSVRADAGLVAELAKMQGAYLAPTQTMTDELPSGEIKEETIDAGGRLWIESVEGSKATLWVSYPGLAERLQTFTELADGRIRVTERNSEVMGCDVTIEVPADPTGFEFTIDDVKFNGADREFCLSRWPYPLFGTYRWTFLPEGGKIRILTIGAFTDLDGIYKKRRLTLDFERKTPAR